jgi:hypothetical protein
MPVDACCAQSSRRHRGGNVRECDMPAADPVPGHPE